MAAVGARLFCVNFSPKFVSEEAACLDSGQLIVNPI